MKILINVEDGIVTDVYCSEPEGVEVIVRDANDVDNGHLDPFVEKPEINFLINPKYMVY